MIIYIGAASCFGKSQTFKVRIKCHYMSYACGECQPQYNVDEILNSSDGKLDKSKVLGQDIKLVFKSPEEEKKIDAQVEKCIICYDYYVHGYLTFLTSKGYYILNVDTCVVKLRFERCCE